MPLQWEHRQGASATINGEIGKFATRIAQINNGEVAHRMEQDYVMVESLNKEDG